MILVIDVGNTNITLGVYEGGKLTYNWRLSSKIARTQDEFWMLINTMCQMDGVSVSSIKGVAIGSVVPSVTTVIKRFLDNRLKIPYAEVGAQVNGGIKINYQPPEAVGADRICNAVAGFNRFGGPVVIVDFGTATTFDVVSDKAEYLGGIIAPGIETTVTILHQVSAKLPLVDLRFPEKLIGTTTDTSMQSGLMFGGAEMVEGLLKRLKIELGEGTKFIATGGLASVLLPYLPSVDVVDHLLTLDGLYQIYCHHFGKPAGA